MKEITEGELAMLEACQSEKEWSDATRKIKSARDDEYPSDWWAQVKSSGMMDRVLSRWGESSDPKVTTFDTKSDMLKYLGYGK